MGKKYKRIAFQGAHGAYSDLACRTVFPELETLPCDTFEDAFEAVKSEKADLAMIPVDNTLAGRVADVHHLLPGSGLYIINEHFQHIRHALLGVKGTKKENLKFVHSHVHALPQCRSLVKKLKLKAHVHGDTAGAAMEVAERGDKEHGAIASTLAAEIYGLDILEEDVQDADHNTTRFLILSRDPQEDEDDGKTVYITSFIFRVRNIPAALYKAMGGFATNGINMVKLESYVDEKFQVAEFYADIIGHPDSPPVQLALEELGFFASEFKFLGSYPAHEFRKLD
jgi:prephenate dehydratase